MAKYAVLQVILGRMTLMTLVTLFCRGFLTGAEAAFILQVDHRYVVCIKQVRVG
jgi:hypothetical protein